MTQLNLQFFPQIWKSNRFCTEEKLILSLVYNFQIHRGAAYASDYWISDTFGLRLNRVSELVAALSSAGYINIWYEEETRYMSLDLSRMQEESEPYNDEFGIYEY
jgi:hypothetical protein